MDKNKTAHQHTGNSLEFTWKDMSSELRPNVNSNDEIGSNIQVADLQRELKSARQEIGLLRGILNALPSVVTVFGSDGQLVHGNLDAEDKLWQPARDSICSFKAACETHKQENCRVCAFQHALGGKGCCITERHSLTDEHREVNLIPFKPDDGKNMVVQCWYDITGEITLARELKAAKDAAEAADKAKTDFLTTMSHEIRTPMNGLLGMLDLALDTELDAEQREYLEAVENSAESLLVLINHVLDFSKIEAGVIAVDNQAFRLRKRLSALRTMFLHRAEERSLQFKFTIPDDVPDVIVGDFPRIRQVLTNLLDNALKFTDSGSIELAVDVDGMHGDEAILRFSVKDTGIGIRQEHSNAIFERFVQSDSSASRQYQGAGLGLAICRKLVELMGGKLQVVSSPGEGAEFFFTLTLKVGHLPKRREAGSDEMPSVNVGDGKRVLVVDDNQVNLRFMEVFLNKQGFEVKQAMNGLEALEMAEQHPFDIILMDIAMPHMDGLEATKRIRQSKTFASTPDVPVIAMTAHALKGDRESFLAAGMSGYVGKPINLDELLRLMYELLLAEECKSA